MPYHCELEIQPKLPNPWNAEKVWVKGDMVNAVGFHRLNLVSTGKDSGGKRIYRFETLTSEQIRQVRACVLRSLGMNGLTKHL